MEGKPLAYIKILSVGGGSGSEDSCLNYTVSEQISFTQAHLSRLS
jgi:hypothetical protein